MTCDVTALSVVNKARRKTKGLHRMDYISANSGQNSQIMVPISGQGKDLLIFESVRLKICLKIAFLCLERHGKLLTNDLFSYM